MKFNYSVFVSAFIFCTLVIGALLLIISMSVYATGDTLLGITLIIINFIVSLFLAVICVDDK